MESLNSREGLFERIHWLIKLRWIAVTGVFLSVFIAVNVLKIPVPDIPLYAIALILGIYNLTSLVYVNRSRANFPALANRIANTQIAIDLFILASLVHFSGGIENPFIFYFIFHMIIASILLSRRASFLQATFAVILFSMMVALEYLGILPHYCLVGFVSSDLHNNAIHISGIAFVFVSTLYIAVYMATSISRRLREREASLKEANALLKQKDRIKSEYVLRVTHDIKEHLAAIQSCIEPVTGGIVGSLNEKQMNLLQRADERAGKLMFFVKALLEVTSIKLSKEIRMGHFDFSDMLKDAIHTIARKAGNKNIFLSSTVEPGIQKIRGAREYIQELISNLLANSVKYTPRNGKVDIDVIDKGNSILIQIKDTGIGIPGEELSKVFDEFYRASNAREIEKDGTGLGLSIAKQVVARHNGKIWVESVQGKGTTFFIMLPK
ncbi:MAG: HAMP domain-containing histidine kinase [Candidatus Omnitrophica bacterium]|nr:HAMP domain-containing histidine kinase [Candidatus Omnitrophota bacterium]MBU4590379.1 HAMP domain-containing histidine kinase [Candidatus Omnitrophota bacterium]